jgi:mannose/fructose/N-acetylgalactosamine-specific phosphotransferase system component IIB
MNAQQPQIGQIAKQQFAKQFVESLTLDEQDALRIQHLEQKVLNARRQLTDAESELQKAITSILNVRHYELIN